MERKEFLEKVLAYGRQAGFADCEVYYRGGKAFEVLILEGEVSDYENSREEGLAFRGNIDGRTGYAYTEQLTEDAIAYLVETAKENAALLSPEDCEELYAGEESYPELEGVNAALEELRVEEKSTPPCVWKQRQVRRRLLLWITAHWVHLWRRLSSATPEVWMFPLRRILRRLMFLRLQKKAEKPKQAPISGRHRIGMISTLRKRAEWRQSVPHPIWGQCLCQVGNTM